MTPEEEQWEKASMPLRLFIDSLVDRAEAAESDVERLAADLLVQQRATDEAEVKRDDARADREQMARLMKHYAERAEKAEAEVQRQRDMWRVLDLAVRKVTHERDDALAEVERLRRGEEDGVFTSVVHECCSRAQEAEAEVARLTGEVDLARGSADLKLLADNVRLQVRIDRVRALCDEVESAPSWIVPIVRADEVRAALGGEAS